MSAASSASSSSSSSSSSSQPASTSLAASIAAKPIAVLAQPTAPGAPAPPAAPAPIAAPSRPLAEVLAPKKPLDYVKLSKNCGAKVSRICLGMMSYGENKDWFKWILDEKESLPFVKRALELGINFFDTADIYSFGASERVLGRALKTLKADREQLFIATKVRFDMGGINRGGLSRKHIMEAIDNSLKRLQMDYVDLYQIHRYDNETPIEETMKALHDLVVAGKVRYIGASAMHAWQFQKMQNIAEKNGWTKFVTMQNHYNAVYREEEREMIPYCVDSGVGCLPYSPLARGFLCNDRSPSTVAAAVASANAPIGPETKVATTRMVSDPLLNRYSAESDVKVFERVKEIAAKKGVSNAQIALAWLLSKPGVTAPIIGATKMYQLEEAVAALDVHLTAEEARYIDAMYQPHPVIGHT